MKFKSMQHSTVCLTTLPLQILYQIILSSLCTIPAMDCLSLCCLKIQVRCYMLQKNLLVYFCSFGSDLQSFSSFIEVQSFFFLSQAHATLIQTPYLLPNIFEASSLQIKFGAMKYRLNSHLKAQGSLSKKMIDALSLTLLPSLIAGTLV